MEEKNDHALIGEAIPFDYDESVQWIKKAVLPYMSIFGELGDVTTFAKMAYVKYESDEHLRVKLQNGEFKTFVLYPKNERELKIIIVKGHCLLTEK